MKKNENRTLYLAYGSNMNLEQMEKRCPAAEVVGTATLTGYRLLFRGSDGSAVANVERHKGGRVPVLLWSITDADEAALDVYEGYPRLYRKETVKVKFEGKTVEAMVYIMNKGRDLGIPSRYYYEVIRTGYRESGLKTAALRKAVKDSMTIVEDEE